MLLVLLELFLAAGLFVGVAPQPVANKVAPSAAKIKICFMLFLRAIQTA
jgi:hypothetical protein